MKHKQNTISYTYILYNKSRADENMSVKHQDTSSNLIQIRYVITYFLTITTLFLNAQDMHFSQFYSLPSNINPAFTGFFNNDYFVAAAYKTQWSTVSTPYQTVASIAEVSLLKNKHPNSIIGVGTSIIHDWAGSIHYTTDEFNLNVSYLQVLDKNRNHTIGIGFQNSMTLRKFDISKATFGNQFNGYNAFDQGINPIENGLITKQIDYNLGIGGVYSYAPKEHYNLFVSVSGYNIIRPNVSFFSTSENRLYTRFATFIGGEFGFKKHWSILPSALFQIQGPSKEIVFGSFVRYGIIKNKKERLAVNLGVWYRYLDAVIPAVKLEYKGLNVTVNFDMNVSKLSKVSRFNGSGELSISYSGLLFKEHKKMANPLFCPSFIY